MRKIKKIGIIIIIGMTVGYGFYTGLETETFTIASRELPQAFDGYKIAFISDFHCKEFGKNEEILLDAIEKGEPDAIVFTGDMIDEDHEDFTPMIDLLEGLSGKYPIYAITGNHEAKIPANYDLLLSYYDEYGVNFIDNSSMFIEKDDAKIGIYGKAYCGNYFTKEFLQGPDENCDYNILLYHDAGAFPPIKNLGFDLILAGHTHGGIIRLPFVGGMINNNGTLFSKYDNGMYIENNCILISSRGLGDARLPRFYNRFELIMVILKKV